MNAQSKNTIIHPYMLIEFIIACIVVLIVLCALVVAGFVIFFLAHYLGCI